MSIVYFLPCVKGEVPIDKLTHLVEKTGWTTKLAADDLVAVKTHFGEEGNEGHIAPAYVARFVEAVKRLGAKPFLVETSTLYVGRRSNAVDHILLAHEHGYTVENVGAPIIMADGLRGQAQTTVKIAGRHYRDIKVASDTRVYDAMLVLTHLTGHILSGMGATIKNLGMGLVSRAGKRNQHSEMMPRVTSADCTACGRCVEWCPTGAIRLPKGARSAAIDQKTCIGCAECYAVCPAEAIAYDWNAEQRSFQEKMAEHALGVVAGLGEKVTYVTFLTSIRKDCDCMGTGYTPFVDDIGVIASNDAVAIDQAAAELVNQRFKKDFFKHLYPNLDYTIQLRHAESIGLGSREYSLVES
jgi:uncharacterized Fe-S center protein